MSAGLQIFDASGNLTLDITTAFARIITIQQVYGSGSLDLPVTTDEAVWWGFIPKMEDSYSDDSSYSVYESDGKLYYNFPGDLGILLVGTY